VSYDPAIADRVRAALAGRDVIERRMFGTLAFMVDGRLVAAAAPDGLLVKADAGGDPLARPATMGTRPMKGWVLVAPEADLEAWVARASGGAPPRR
jgi:TfoX N-terminal domain